MASLYSELQNNMVFREYFCVGIREEMKHFEMCFFKIVIATVHGRPGNKLLVGDNLASHFSPSVMQSAIENDVYLTSSPPDSTHIVQSLDVAVFSPLKLSGGKS